MTNCRNCEAELGVGARFCQACGTAVAEPVSLSGLASQAKEIACEAADDMIAAGKTVASEPLGKKMLAGAAIGAAVSLPVPVIGWAAGATVGAGLVAFKHLLNKP